jgi:tetratricopeptide (TPR) repeat protein
MSIRDQAKLYFQKGKYVAAAEAYTEAITLEPDNASLYCNRALCNQKVNKWQNVVGDAGEKQTKTFPPPKSPVPHRPMRWPAVAHISLLRLLPPNQVEHAAEKLEQPLQSTWRTLVVFRCLIWTLHVYWCLGSQGKRWS